MSIHWCSELEIADRTLALCCGLVYGNGEIFRRQGAKRSQVEYLARFATLHAEDSRLFHSAYFQFRAPAF
jgi:hypothetical protein